MAVPLPPWRKVLYEKQPQADNYVDASFLASLRANRPVRHPTFADVLIDSFVVVAHVSTAVTILLVCDLTLREAVDWGTLLLCDLGILVVLIWLKMLEGAKRFDGGKQGGKVAGPLKDGKGERTPETHFGMALMVGGLYVLCPILKTLTQSISSDTLWASAGALYFLHLVSNDYSFSQRALGATATPQPSQPGFSHVSVMAAVFASLLLSSRLHSQEQVFSFILLALLLVVWFPAAILRTPLISRPWRKGILLPSLVLPCWLLLPSGGLALSACYLLSAVAAALAGSWLYLRLHHGCKRDLSGPWDPASIQFS